MKIFLNALAWTCMVISCLLVLGISAGGLQLLPFVMAGIIGGVFTLRRVKAGWWMLFISYLIMTIGCVAAASSEPVCMVMAVPVGLITLLLLVVNPIVWRKFDDRPAPAEYPADGYVPEGVARETVGTEPAGYRSTKGITRLLTVFWGVTILLSLVNAVLDCHKLRMFSMSLYKVYEANETMQAIEGVIALLALPIIILSLVYFMIWVYRVNRNAHTMSSNTMQYSPGWAVGSFFVPFLNLYRPWEMMKEVWESGESASLPKSDWKGRATLTLVSAWWGFWLLDNFASYISAQMMFSAETMDQIMSATRVSLVSDIISLPAAILCIALVLTVQYRQENKRIVSDQISESQDVLVDTPQV